MATIDTFPHAAVSHTLSQRAATFLVTDGFIPDSPHPLLFQANSPDLESQALLPADIRRRHPGADFASIAAISLHMTGTNWDHVQRAAIEWAEGENVLVHVNIASFPQAPHRVEDGISNGRLFGLGPDRAWRYTGMEYVPSDELIYHVRSHFSDLHEVHINDYAGAMKAMRSRFRQRSLAAVA